MNPLGVSFVWGRGWVVRSPSSGYGRHTTEWGRSFWDPRAPLRLAKKLGWGGNPVSHCAIVHLVYHPYAYSKDGSREVAAIASSRAAEVFGLQVLDQGQYLP